MLGIGGGLFGFAGLFYFAAEYEHLSGWKWALASVAVTATVKGLFPGSFIFVLPAQFGLFLVMWWAHMKNQAQREVEREQRVTRAREETAANTDWNAQEREREAVAEAAAKERQERVRLAREQREREEREMGKGTET